MFISKDLNPREEAQLSAAKACALKSCLLQFFLNFTLKVRSCVRQEQERMEKERRRLEDKRARDQEKVFALQILQSNYALESQCSEWHAHAGEGNLIKVCCEREGVACILHWKALRAGYIILAGMSRRL